jgi:hypothetical protein
MLKFDEFDEGGLPSTVLRKQGIPPSTERPSDRMDLEMFHLGKGHQEDQLLAKVKKKSKSKQESLRFYSQSHNADVSTSY